MDSNCRQNVSGMDAIQLLSPSQTLFLNDSAMPRLRVIGKEASTDIPQPAPRTSTYLI
jgi:hypothetical protein